MDKDKLIEWLERQISTELENEEHSIQLVKARVDAFEEVIEYVNRRIRSEKTF